MTTGKGGYQRSDPPSTSAWGSGVGYAAHGTDGHIRAPSGRTRSAGPRTRNEGGLALAAARAPGTALAGLVSAGAALGAGELIAGVDDGLTSPVESGPDEGTLSGMTDDPVATAASSNPVLTTLVTAVSEADLVDTLNSADAVTVFAPTDCAFAAPDQATLDAALADPTGLLTQVLGFHGCGGPAAVVRGPGQHQ